jgi:Aspartyl protease
MPGTPFRYLHHLVTVPVRIDDRHDACFILDSGIGLTVVSASFAERAGIAVGPTTFSGQRMSGQEVELPLARLSSLQFGELRRGDVEVGVLDMAGFPPELDEIDGFLSLAYFDDRPFTVDYEHAVVLLGGSNGGVPVPLEVEPDGPSVTAFMRLVLPGGKVVRVEVDMGSDALILDDGHAAGVGVVLDDPSVRVVHGTDETGHAYTRRFTTLRGPVHPEGAPSVAQEDPPVMFQKIRYDGLVGDAFLRRFAVTFDLPAGRIEFA